AVAADADGAVHHPRPLLPPAPARKAPLRGGLRSGARTRGPLPPDGRPPSPGGGGHRVRQRKKIPPALRAGRPPPVALPRSVQRLVPRISVPLRTSRGRGNHHRG